jgi:hypothetical protein
LAAVTPDLVAPGFGPTAPNLTVGGSLLNVKPRLALAARLLHCSRRGNDAARCGGSTTFTSSSISSSWTRRSPRTPEISPRRTAYAGTTPYISRPPDDWTTEE